MIRVITVGRDGSSADELADQVNVFLIGWSPDGAADERAALRALEDATLLREKLGGEIRSWRSPDGCVVVAFLHHDSTEIPGVRYVHTETDRVALLAGMPLEWSDEHGTARLVLDAAAFLAGDLARETLDGRCAIARYDATEGVLEVRTDHLGVYPMYVAEGTAATWIGNAPFLISRASGRTDVDLEALGSFIGLGWSPAGTTFWRGVQRMTRGTLEVRRREGSVTRHDLLPTTAIRDMFGGRPEMLEAARVLTATIRALGSWPARPNVVPVSAGRDSRVIFAAAVAAGIDFQPTTIAYPHIAGFPETPDVILGGQVVEALGMERVVSQPTARGGLRWSAGLVRQATHGLVSLGETLLIERREGDAPIEIVHSGHGGELSRGLMYPGEDPSPADLVDRIVGRWIYRWPRPIVRTEILATARSYVRDWVDRHLELEFAPSDIPDTFWLLERMAKGVAPPQHLQELSNDTTAALLSPRMLPFTFAGSCRERRSEPLHYEILRELAPELTSIPFNGLSPAWPSFPSAPARARRQRDTLYKVQRELHRRAGAWRAQRQGGLDPVLADARRELAAARDKLADHPIWEVVDRTRTDRLITRDAYRLDPRSQVTIWRLATVLAADATTD